MADFSAFIVAGGGASLLYPLLKKNYPEVHRMIPLQDAQFSIARGYFLYGEATLMQERENG